MSNVKKLFSLICFPPVVNIIIWYNYFLITLYYNILLTILVSECVCVCVCVCLFPDRLLNHFLKLQSIFKFFLWSCIDFIDLGELIYLYCWVLWTEKNIMLFPFYFLLCTSAVFNTLFIYVVNISSILHLKDFTIFGLCKKLIWSFE